MEELKVKWNEFWLDVRNQLEGIVAQIKEIIASLNNFTSDEEK